MTDITVKHYGASISVKISPFPACCGAKIVHAFHVRGEESLTLEKKHKLYAALMRKIIPNVTGVLVSADCVLNFGEWAELKRSTGGGGDRSAKTEDAGDISLEDFCEHFNMVRGPVARNSNSGNLVASFSLAIHAANDDGTYETLEVEEPDFSDDEQAVEQAGDVSAIIASIQAILEGGS